MDDLDRRVSYDIESVRQNVWIMIDDVQNLNFTLESLLTFAGQLKKGKNKNGMIS